MQKGSYARRRTGSDMQACKPSVAEVQLNGKPKEHYKASRPSCSLGMADTLKQLVKMFIRCAMQGENMERSVAQATRAVDMAVAGGCDRTISTNGPGPHRRPCHSLHFPAKWSVAVLQSPSGS